MKCDKNQSVAVVASVLIDAAQNKIIKNGGLPDEIVRSVECGYEDYLQVVLAVAVNSRLIKVINRNPPSMKS